MSKGLELNIENSYEGFKSILLDINSQRELLISQGKEFKLLADAGISVKSNTKNIERVMKSIGEIGMLWYQILHEANQHFPEIMNDIDLKSLESEAFDPYEEERVKLREEMDKKAKDTFSEILKK